MKKYIYIYIIRNFENILDLIYRILIFKNIINIFD